MEQQRAWLFDIDGVIADPVTRTITKPEIVSFIISELQKGNPVGLISGRGLLWLRSRIIKVFENYLDDHPGLSRSLLDLLYLSSEFGGVEATYQSGERSEKLNQDLMLPKEAWDALALVSNSFVEYVFIDEEKQTQFTLEAGVNEKENYIDTHGDEIVAALVAVVTAFPQLEVHKDRIAINVKNKKANKNYATVQFLTWLAQTKPQPMYFYGFGDSPSDVEIGQALFENNLQFTFVYVGSESDLANQQVAFPVHFTKERLIDGTLEFLATFF